MVSEVLGISGSGGDLDTEDHLSAVCAALVLQIGKLKRTTMGWEDKRDFLQLYNQKRK